ncbi:uncharacterized protein AB9X84_014534 [Acanthopagrus schlegelii]
MDQFEIHDDVERPSGNPGKGKMLGKCSENINADEDKIHTLEPKRPEPAHSAAVDITRVMLGLLYLLLLTGLITLVVLLIKLTEERDQLQTSNNNLIKERDQLQTSYNNLTEERDQLQTSYNNLTEERDQLQSSYNNLTEERDQLQTSYNNLTEERDQLQSSYNNLTEERDQLQTSYNNLTEERDQLQTSYNNLTEERDQLQASYNNLTEERDRLQTSYNNLIGERDRLQTSYNNLIGERDRLQTSYNNLIGERDRLQTSYNNLIGERDRLQTSYNNLIGERDRLQTSYNNLIGERDRLQTSYNNLIGERDRLQTSYNNLIGERDRLQTSYNNLNNQRDQLQRQLNFLKYYLQQGWVYFSDSLYYISSTKKTWWDSRYDCLWRAADLVIIGSRAEQFLFKNKDFIRQHQKEMWIGLTDRQWEGVWTWVDGTRLTTSFWDSGEPNNHGGNEDCVEILSLNSVYNWNDETCGNTNYWMCEKKMILVQEQLKLKKSKENTLTRTVITLSGKNMEMVFYEAEDDIAMINDAPVKGVSFQSYSDEEKDERTAAVPGANGKNSSRGVAALCLGALCLLLLIGFKTLVSQYNKSKSKQERAMFLLQTSYNNLTEERDQLQTSYDKLINEGQQLEDNLTRQKDQLQTSYYNLSEERDQLQTSYNNLIQERDQLQTSSNNLSKERDQLQTSYNNLIQERDQLQTSYNNLIQERDQLQTSYNNLSEVRDQLQTSYYNLTTEKDGLQERVEVLTKDRNHLQGKLQDTEARLKNLTDERANLERTLNIFGMYFRGSFYYVSSTKKTWQQSRDDCLQKGADLMIINSKEEQDFANQFKKYMWIGLTDSQREGTWKWVDGTLLTKSYWTSGEPNGGTHENCGDIKNYDAANSWNDESCSHSLYWVCEKKLRP